MVPTSLNGNECWSSNFTESSGTDVRGSGSSRCNSKLPYSSVKSPTPQHRITYFDQFYEHLPWITDFLRFFLLQAHLNFEIELPISILRSSWSSQRWVVSLLAGLRHSSQNWDRLVSVHEVWRFCSDQNLNVLVFIYTKVQPHFAFRLKSRFKCSFRPKNKPICPPPEQGHVSNLWGGKCS